MRLGRDADVLFCLSFCPVTVRSIPFRNIPAGKESLSQSIKLIDMIVWNPSTTVISLGPLAIHWYSLCWCIGLALSYIVVYRLYKAQQIPQEKFDPLFMYCFIGILVGARLGHCLLYDPQYFLQHPVEMFLPVRQLADGSWKFTGYAGLASHGGTLGLILALLAYTRKYKIKALHVLDNIAIATGICACFIRLGNLMNSEIVGQYTGTAFGFVFVQNGDTAPRHPAQLYEAVFYLVMFLAGLWLYRKYSAKVGSGFFFGYCLISIFVFRFLVEFLKEIQEPWEQSLQAMIGLNQGQLLSIPLVVIGIYFLWNSRKA